MNLRFPVARFTLLLVLFSIPMAAFAGEPVGKASGGGMSIEWFATVSNFDRIMLTVSGPDGEIYSKEFPAGKPLSFRIQDLGTNVLDGQYNYELRVVPRVSPSVAKQLANARAANDDKAAKKIMRDAGIDVNVVQSGTFTVLNRSIVSPDLQEAGASAGLGGGISTNITNGGGKVAVNDQVIPDDLIVQGSACVGLDCVNNESFGFDTIRLKENNTRIKFDDTSTSAGFPANDWQLTANDSASGGSSKFSIEDITGAKVPFTVTAGAATNSIFADSTGRIGFRTSTPVLDLHVATSNTPAIRLEQNNSGGFTAQTWDIAGNEANFFVRDVTSGSRLPFRIRPGAPTSSIDISNVGNVGIGTASPSEQLHVFKNADANIFDMVENTNTGTGAAAVLSARSDTARWDAKAHASTRVITRFGVTLGGWSEATAVSGNGAIFGSNTNTPVIIGNNNIDRIHIDTDGDIGINCNAPGSDLVIASGAGCTNPSSSINAGSTQFTVASSRTFKENIQPVTVPDILSKIHEIGVYRYDFVNGPKDRIGLIAEDFHTVFERGSEKYIDGSDVQIALWLAIQQLTDRNTELMERIDDLEKQLDVRQNR